MAIESINPANGERIRSYEEMPAPHLGELLGAVRGAFESWRTTKFEERSRRMHAAAARLR